MLTVRFSGVDSESAMPMDGQYSTVQSVPERDCTTNGSSDGASSALPAAAAIGPAPSISAFICAVERNR